MILRNAIKCKKCHVIIESFHRHDFKWCPCHSVAVDGGHDYLKRAGDLEGYIEMSESSFDNIEKETPPIMTTILVGDMVGEISLDPPLSALDAPDTPDFGGGESGGGGAGGSFD